ncbi:hypothetical protein PJI16_09745 [Nitrospira sp. MA-1]|nr:hypothetical protein [Nitrospira sp. MA-1]
MIAGITIEATELPAALKKTYSFGGGAIFPFIMIVVLVGGLTIDEGKSLPPNNENTPIYQCSMGFPGWGEMQKSPTFPKRAKEIPIAKGGLHMGNFHRKDDTHKTLRRLTFHPSDIEHDGLLFAFEEGRKQAFDESFEYALNYFLSTPEGEKCDNPKLHVALNLIDHLVNRIWDLQNNYERLEHENEFKAEKLLENWEKIARLKHEQDMSENKISSKSIIESDGSSKGSKNCESE